jgi:hypothetical protein
MFRYNPSFSVWLIGLFAMVSASPVTAESSESFADQDSDITASSSKKKEAKKRKPRKRAPHLVVVKEDNAVARPETASPMPEAVSEPLLQQEPLATTDSQNVIPEQVQAPSSTISTQDEQTNSTPTVTLLPNPPKKFQGVVRRLCHPVKGKKFFLDIRWKKGSSQNIAAYKVYVNGRCEKEILATKKPSFQVLRHTRDVRKVYEIASVDKNGQESPKVPLVVTRKPSHEPLCSCRVSGYSTDVSILTSEYLNTLTKEQIINLFQKVRTEILKAQERSEKHSSHRP